jgi:hypothetical protein
MALRLQPTALPQPMALLKRMRPLEDMPVEPTVALLVPLNRLALISSTHLALVRRRMTFLVKHMPVKALARGNGTPLRARIGGATCASRTPIPCAVMVSKHRVRNERRSPLTPKPRRCGAFLCRPLGNADAQIAQMRGLILSGSGWAIMLASPIRRHDVLPDLRFVVRHLIIIDMIRIVMMIIDDGAVLVAPLDSQRKPSRLSFLSRRLGSLRRY